MTIEQLFFYKKVNGQEVRDSCVIKYTDKDDVVLTQRHRCDGDCTMRTLCSLLPPLIRTMKSGRLR
jgi:hypothetical protein